MGSIPPELSLDFRPPSTRTVTTTTVTAAASEEQSCCYVPKTIDELVGQVSMIGNVAEKLLKLDDYVTKLEDEMKKIDAFKRELPLCMLLLNDAIRTLKEESTKYKTMDAGPVLEEFIPLKKNCDEDEKSEMVVETSKKDKDSREKMSWMSSVQLWNSDNPASKSDFDINEAHSRPETKKRVVEAEIQEDLFESCKNGSVARAFVPFQGCSSLPVMITRKENEYELPGVVPGLSLQTPGTKKLKEDIGSGGLNSRVGGSRAVSCSVSSVQSNVRAAVSQQQQQTSRKQRRCWSPELHRRFVDALQKLGGCQAATPKQIRELMQVDGLTNDEVKSHLQKYRLHTRRLPTTTGTSTNQPVVVLGALWLPQDQHGESSKQSNSHSGSPQGPLQLGGASRGTSMTGGDSMEDEEDDKSESHSWKSHIRTSQRTNV
ncbi:transcription factor HHO2-like [Coffea eugenioides]|uniref:transcription factor HHO2-like n=1 Tax=Coffea eugenioides TaxID=49369 RepID=UPI000F60D861|nr:transcription factor HHO2-like [Coffea eugenioides]